MKKTLASVVIIAFSGLLCTSLLAFFNGSMVGSHYLLSSQIYEHSYFMTYMAY